MDEVIDAERFRLLRNLVLYNNELETTCDEVTNLAEDLTKQNDMFKTKYKKNTKKHKLDIEEANRALNEALMKFEDMKSHHVDMSESIEDMNVEMEEMRSGLVEKHRVEMEEMRSGLVEVHRVEMEEMRSGLAEEHRVEMEEMRSGLVEEHRVEMEEMRSGLAEEHRVEMDRHHIGLEEMRTALVEEHRVGGEYKQIFDRISNVMENTMGEITNYSELIAEIESEIPDLQNEWKEIQIMYKNAEYGGVEMDPTLTEMVEVSTPLDRFQSVNNSLKRKKTDERELLRKGDEAIRMCRENMVDPDIGERIFRFIDVVIRWKFDTDRTVYGCN